MKDFFRAEDYQEYLTLMAKLFGMIHVTVCCFCRTPNHSRLIAVPETEEDLRMARGETYRRYFVMFNLQKKWTGRPPRRCHC